MSTYSLNLTLENIRTITVMFIDIFVMWLVLYYAIRIVRSNSRTIQIFKGILLVLIVDGIAKLFGLKTLAYFADIFMNWGFLAIIIIFQPEIRSLLERLGKSNVFSRITTLTGDEKENLVDQIVKATMLLSQDQTGALISIEQAHSLDDFIATGTKLNSDVTAELLTSIFVTSTPLHDGAVIIQGDKIACASAYFPPTNLELPSRYGARHRAAIGISEITDAVTIVVSEETGTISIAEGGKIFPVNRKQLRDYLLRVICGEETEVSGSHHAAKATPAREVVIDDTRELKRKQIEKEKNATAKKQDTGVLSKLAIKKQEEKTPEKVEAEEVIPAETADDSQPETVIAPEAETDDDSSKKSGLFGLFGRKETQKPAAAQDEDEKIEELEEEMTEIKLPKKKNRPAPSYPKQAAGNRFEETPEPQETPAKQAEVKKPEPVQAPSSVETIREKAKPAVEKPAEEEVAPAPRMTPDEVKAARERAKEMYSARHKEAEPAKTNRYENTSGVNRMTNDERQFDTSKIDVSELMGFNDDLDKTFKMVDSMDEEETGSSASKKKEVKNDGRE